MTVSEYSWVVAAASLTLKLTPVLPAGTGNGFAAGAGEKNEGLAGVMETRQPEADLKRTASPFFTLSPLGENEPSELQVIVWVAMAQEEMW
jgi:hypothetical protein